MNKIFDYKQSLRLHLKQSLRAYALSLQLLGFLLVSSLYFLFPASSYAVEDPLGKPNNSMGIHILFPAELEEAAKLVNSSGGEWGYITIPIQIGDRDLEQWQKFMDDAKRLKLIPLIRLATEPDPLNTSVWRRPTDYDLVDFANFLNSLSWPTKNRYVILFNEVNRSDEWGGLSPNPSEYAEIVKYSDDVFKSRNPNFYLILGGMDAAAPNDYVKHMNGFTYLEELILDPEVIDSVDAFSSHSYPNPEFSAPPSETKKNNVVSYRYEYDMINDQREEKLPVFITETGWSDKTLPGSVISKYYTSTMRDIWGEDADKIVAITPFLLNSEGGGPFDHFSLLKNGEEKVYYKTLVDMQKSKGEPMLETASINTISSNHSAVLASVTFPGINEGDESLLYPSPFMRLYFKTILGIN